MLLSPRDGVKRVAGSEPREAGGDLIDVGVATGEGVLYVGYRGACGALVFYL